MLRSNRIGKNLVKTVMIFLLILSLIALGLGVYNLVEFNFELSQFIYVFMGVFFLPIEYLITGKIGLLNVRENSWISLFVLIVFIVVLFTLVQLSKFNNDLVSYSKRKVSKVFISIFALLFACFFAFSAVVLSLKSFQIANILNYSSPEIIINLTTLLGGVNFTYLLSVIFAYIFAVFCFFGFVLLLFKPKKHVVEQKVKIYTGTNFYSNEFLQEELLEQENEQKQEQKTESKGIKESDLKAQKLVNKVRILDELRKEGKISTAEYTRLRQSAIRRYKD